jgi:mannose-6-phosphate isomerase-like protein (cupin superfamily)
VTFGVQVDLQGDTMRCTTAAVIVASGVLAAGLHGTAQQRQSGQPGSTGRGTEGQTVIVEQAPADRAVAIPKDKLDQYLKDMDAKHLQTLRMLEGGKYNVNIRRITNAETALIHPKTIDVWVVLQGSGTLTTGGQIENGRIVGGRPHPLAPGDVEFIPANVPHGVSGVDGSITWLNVRWDTDWPANAELGAGNLPGGGGRSLAPLEYAQTDHAVAIPKEKLDGYRRDMETKDQGTLRMIEGGHFNVNIRRIKAPSTENHPLTIDTWVVLEGSGTVTTGFKTENGKMVPGTGVNQPVKTGDVMFVPAGLNHGFSTVSGVVAWLNIRWDVNWDPK